MAAHRSRNESVDSPSSRRVLKVFSIESNGRPTSSQCRARTLSLCRDRPAPIRNVEQVAGIGILRHQSERAPFTGAAHEDPRLLPLEWARAAVRLPKLVMPSCVRSLVTGPHLARPPERTSLPAGLRDHVFMSRRLRFDNAGTWMRSLERWVSGVFFVQHAKPLNEEGGPLRTAETVQNQGVSSAHEAPGVALIGLRAMVRGVGMLAALLAFGLLGALAGVRQLIRGRQMSDPACACCRRRRIFARAGTFVLAGLVLAGSALAVHQHVSGPGLPRCGTERATTDLNHSLAEVGGGAWLQTRQLLTAPVTGLVRHYVNDRGGGLCAAGPVTLAFLPSAASDSTFAVGSVILTDDQSPMSEGNGTALARHESRHVTQWALLTLAGGPLAMPLLYAADEAFFPHSRNHFERAADLDDGGYPQPEGLGPQPQWAKVGVLVMLLLVVGRRRLRWISRVFTGGAAAAVARQRGLCPLHSRGWFRLRAT